MNMNEPDITDDVQDSNNPIGSCAWVHDNAPGYATGSLDLAELDLIADHRLLCRECDGALDRLTSILALSGLGIERQTPSPEVKTRLLATVAAEQSTQPTANVSAAAIAVDSNAHAPNQSWWRAPRFATTVMLAGILALAGWGIYAQTEMTDRADTIAELEQSNQTMALELNSYETGAREIGPGISSYQLTNVSPAEDDAGGVVVSGDGETTAVFSIWNMPDDHESYHVICESERGELLAAAEIFVNENGTGTVTVNLPSPVTEFRAVHVIPTDSNGNAVADLLDQDILKALMNEPAPEE